MDNTIPEYPLSQLAGLSLAQILVQTGLAASTSKARQLIAQNGVILAPNPPLNALDPTHNPLMNTVLTTDLNFPFRPGDIIRVGKRNFLKFT